MHRQNLSASEAIVASLVVVTAVAGSVVWVGAWLATTATGHHFDASFADAVHAAIHLRSHLGDPAAAWPTEPHVPGPVLYWAATTLAVALGAAAVAITIRVVDRGRVGTVRRRPLGVDARAHFATRRDLAPLVVHGHQPDRFTLGRHGRLHLATERPPQSARRRRRRDRHAGDRGAVALIGPSRCGKTTAAVTGILGWDGPAVLSSVKSDLLTATYYRRRHLGTVLVYDPTNTTRRHSAVWSPLRAATTVLGAQRAARALCEAAPRDDSVKGGLDYWLAQSEILLFGLLFAAAHAGHDMARVCEWVMVQDRPRDDNPGDVQPALQRLLQSPDDAVRDGAARASQAVMSIWEMEDETRSSVYGTAQTIVWPWADPGVANAARGNSLSLDWLLHGPNTVYLCAPIEDQERLAPAFGGLLNDLVKQAFLRVAATGRPLDPPLLIVIDEAGNTPLRSLPQYASTLAGLGIQLVTVWQSIAQIEAAYQRHADTILTNHKSKLFFSGLSDPAAFRYLAQVLGDAEVETHSRSDADDERHSRQLSTSREQLVPPHAARQMPPGDALLVHGTLPPAHIQTSRWWTDRRGASNRSARPDFSHSR